MISFKISGALLLCSILCVIMEGVRAEINNEGIVRHLTVSRNLFKFGGWADYFKLLRKYICLF